MAADLSSKTGFFHLPRELRDKIYAFALSEPSGLYYWRTGPYNPEFTKYPGSATAFNQLQYSSQQLRQETIHLERTLNTLIFQEFTIIGHGDSDGSKTVLKDPAVQFMGFLDTCDHTARLRLRNIRLHYNRRHPLPECRCDPSHQHSIPLDTIEDCPLDVGHNDDLINVALICEYFPQMTVWWHTRALDYLSHTSRIGSTVHHRILLGCIGFARALRPNYDQAKIYQELGFKGDGLRGWEYVFNSCSCERGICWYHRRIGQSYFDPDLLTYMAYMTWTNFRLLPEVDEDWEPKLRAEYRMWGGHDGKHLEARVEKVREFLMNGV